MRYPPSVLDAQAAQELFRFFDKYPVLNFAGFSRWSFGEMTPEAANVIADSGMDILYVDSVKTVALEVIRTLAESNVSDLSLGSLKEISPEVATVLSGFRGAALKLDGLTDPSPEVAETLAGFPKLLSLGGITTLSAAVAKALARHRGELLFDGLVDLPDDVAQALAQHQGTLISFESLRFLFNGAAKALKRYRGKVDSGKHLEALVSCDQG